MFPSPKRNTRQARQRVMDFRLRHRQRSRLKISIVDDGQRALVAGHVVDEEPLYEPGSSELSKVLHREVEERASYARERTGSRPMSGFAKLTV